MKSKDAFGFVVRLAGLWLFFFSGWYIVYGFSVLAGVEKGSNTDEMQAYFFDGAIYMLVALYFLRGAPLLLRFCYPKNADEGPKSAQVP
jgi:hypothetical protein